VVPFHSKYSLIITHFSCFSIQYVSEVVIGAPYSVTEELLDYFKVMFVLYVFLMINIPMMCLLSNTITYQLLY